jgi:hypothetical protein
MTSNVLNRTAAGVPLQRGDAERSLQPIFKPQRHKEGRSKQSGTAPAGRDRAGGTGTEGCSEPAKCACIQAPPTTQKPKCTLAASHTTATRTNTVSGSRGAGRQGKTINKPTIGAASNAAQKGLTNSVQLRLTEFSSTASPPLPAAGEQRRLHARQTEQTPHSGRWRSGSLRRGEEGVEVLRGRAGEGCSGAGANKADGDLILRVVIAVR